MFPSRSCAISHTFRNIYKTYWSRGLETATISSFKALLYICTSFLVRLDAWESTASGTTAQTVISRRTAAIINQHFTAVLSTYIPVHNCQSIASGLLHQTWTWTINVITHHNQRDVCIHLKTEAIM